MSLSPIKMFESSQSSLAQILAGGNQSVMSIMDKAIQIGRDMSNKQLSQEKDLLAMRQQETNMFQRRAENLQQNNEDAINFSRRAFESDRKFGLDVAQETRAGVKDVFAMGDASRRTDIAQQSVDQQGERVDLARSAVDAKTAAVQAKSDQVRSMLSPGGKPFVKGDAMNNYGTGVDKNTRAAELKVALDSKTLTPQEQAAALAEYNTLTQKVPGASKPTDPLITEKRQLDIDKARMATFKEKAASLVTDSEAFLPTATWMAQKFGTDPTTGNIKAAGADGKGGASPAQLAEGLAYKADPVGSEMRFADQYATADEYAEAMPDASPKAKNLRRKFWNEYMAAQGGGDAAPAASAVDSIPGI